MSNRLENLLKNPMIINRWVRLILDFKNDPLGLLIDLAHKIMSKSYNIVEPIKGTTHLSCVWSTFRHASWVPHPYSGSQPPLLPKILRVRWGRWWAPLNSVGSTSNGTNKGHRLDKIKKLNKRATTNAIIKKSQAQTKFCCPTVKLNMAASN